MKCINGQYNKSQISNWVSNFYYNHLYLRLSNITNCAIRSRIFPLIAAKTRQADNNVGGQVNNIWRKYESLIGILAIGNM